MKLKLALIAIMILLLCACSKKEEPSVPSISLEDRSHPQITIVYASEHVASCVEITDKNMDISRKLPRSIIRVKNRASANLPIEYQFVWLDSYGAPLLSSSAWQRTTLPQNGEKSFVDMGKSLSAKTVTFYVRFPTDVEIWVPAPDPVEMLKQQQTHQ